MAGSPTAHCFSQMGKTFGYIGEIRMIVIVELYEPQRVRFHGNIRMALRRACFLFG